MTSSIEMRSQSQQIDDRILEFLDHIREKQLKGHRLTRDDTTGNVKFEPCSFVPYEDVKSYFHDRDKITSLLKSIYGHEKTVPSAETIYSMGLRVFCTLLYINRGHLIRYFMSNDLEDSRLPLRSLPDDLEHIKHSDPTFWADFNQKQWCFFPHKFDLVHINIKVSDLKIFPIAEIEEIDACDGRTVHKIRIHGDYHNLRPKSTDLSAQQQQDRDTFILKSLDGTDSDNMNQYESEVDALHKLGCNGVPGARRTPPLEIIRCFGSFKHNKIYHILLEYADQGTLRDYLSTTPYPQTHDDLTDFWDSLKALAIGVSKIHHVLSGEGEKSIGVFQGYHQDLHLSNILAFTKDPGSRYKMTFKIADLGLTNFVKNPYYLLKASGEGKPGTRTCGSPESHQARHFSNGKFTSGQPDDIWSLACIYSIAATWTVGGWSHVEQYAWYRKQARENLGLSNSDCFHDDNKLLEAVQEWHEGLANERAHYDTIIQRLWQKLLGPAFTDASERVSALTFQVATTQLRQGTFDLPKKSATINPGPAHTDSQMFGPSFHLPRVQTDKTPDPRPWDRHERDIKRSSAGLQSVSDEDLTMPLTNGHEPTATSPNLAKNEGRFTTPEGSRRATTRESMDEPRSAGHRQGVPSKSSLRHTQTMYLEGHPQASVLHRAEDSSKQLTDISYLSINGESPALSSKTSYNTELSDGAKGKRRADFVAHSDDCPANPRRKRKLDHMSVEQLLAWKEARDRRNKLEPRDNTDAMIPSSNLKGYLQGRDHIFLFEDSVTMKPHWRTMYKLFGAMAKFIKDCDKDGLEIFFTVSQKKLKSKKSKPLVDLVMSMQNTLNSSSQPISRLREIWEANKANIRDGKESSFLGRRQKVKLTIYIFTNGDWQTGTGMVSFLRDVVRFLEENKCEDGSVGIQFIQFGDGPEETQRLDDLDKNVRGLLKDIVDREPSNGNVWKMLLGSFLPGFDGECNCQQAGGQTR